MKFFPLLFSGLLLNLGSVNTYSQNKKEENSEKKSPKPAYLNESNFGALQFRNIGPAFASGRIGDFAVNPENPSIYFAVAASGGIWKTENAGTTWQPVFEGYGSYSVGCITMDPSNYNVLWVGTGENNNQRSVGYGDGVYLSEDNGKSWKNMGLKNSEHIGMIKVHPKNSAVVYVAAYGPLWSAGGERGIYKTTDMGKTWERILHVSDNTGFNEIHIDPVNPDVMYATAHQRRRHEWTYISGGPESAIYKTLDGGKTWNKIMNGIPAGDIGRIAFAISPQNSNFLYAMVEGTEKNRGFYRSSDRGASWEKQSDMTTAGNYYQEIIADPIQFDKIYVMDTYAKVTKDGGKSFQGLGEKSKHVDNHAIWIDPRNSNHVLIGCDGGIYESFDQCKTWDFKSNLPITQFYRVDVDNSVPFYFVYGGTQDNWSMGGPARTRSASGIVNSDWFCTNGGDGFQSRIDPQNPNIVYAQSQYGGLVRYDKLSGEAIGIKPVEEENDKAFRWNWDAPLVLSKHHHQRLYFAANVLFRSDDRGNNWKKISPDLSRGIDRNQLPVMGKIWSPEAVAKNQSTSIYGNITALSESPLDENFLVAGTDDGLIQITENGGGSWRKLEKFSGVPDQTLVQFLLCSPHNKNEVYALFNNHRNGDFKPYILKSSDRGNSWKAMVNGLPERGSTYCIAQDHKNPKLLFCGTEFGFYFTIDGGENWVNLKNGLPTIAVRDIAIQSRENDLAIATFGRGFYILDNYSMLQNLQKEDFEAKSKIYPVKNGLVFAESTPLGHRGESFQGSSFFTAPNPPIGVHFDIWVKDDEKTLRELRKEREKEAEEKGKSIAYPSVEELRKEDTEEESFILCRIEDMQGNVVRKLKLPAKKGMKRVWWDGRYAPVEPINFRSFDPSNVYEEPEKGFPAVPGDYQVSLHKYKNGNLEQISDKVPFKLETLNHGAIPPADKIELQKFNITLADIYKEFIIEAQRKNDMSNKIRFLNAAIISGEKVPVELKSEIRKVEELLTQAEVIISGDKVLTSREFEAYPGLYGQIADIVYNVWNTSCGPTGTQVKTLELTKKRLEELKKITSSARSQVLKIEEELNVAKAPYTPGR